MRNIAACNHALFACLCIDILRKDYIHTPCIRQYLPTHIHDRLPVACAHTWCHVTRHDTRMSTPADVRLSWSEHCSGGVHVCDLGTHVLYVHVITNTVRGTMSLCRRYVYSPTYTSTRIIWNMQNCLQTNSYSSPNCKRWTHVRELDRLQNEHSCE
jgi:hypothetical protein